MSDLKKVSTESAFDALPHVMEVYDNLGLDYYRKKVAKENKGKKNIDKMEVGIDLFKYVIKNINKSKEEIFQIVAILENKTPEEVKSQPIFTTIKSLKEMFEDKELMDFFKESV